MKESNVKDVESTTSLKDNGSTQDVGRMSTQEHAHSSIQAELRTPGLQQMSLDRPKDMVMMYLEGLSSDGQETSTISICGITGTGGSDELT